MLQLDTLVGELAEACRHKENHAFLRPFLETAVNIINRGEEEELKPCPFCGRKVELRLSPLLGSDSVDEFWSIHCECSMGSPDALYDENQKAQIIHDWNTRAGA